MGSIEKRYCERAIAPFSAAEPLLILPGAMATSNATIALLGEIADDVKSMADYRIFPVLFESMLFCKFFPEEQNFIAC